jgi:hypothetical protein
MTKCKAEVSSKPLYQWQTPVLNTAYQPDASSDSELTVDDHGSNGWYWPSPVTSLPHCHKLLLRGSRPRVLGCRANKASNVYHPRAEWCEVLYQNTVAGIHCFHFLGKAWTKHRKYVSKHWLTRSVYPSLCGWYDEFIRKLLPESLNRLCQKLLVKIGSWSEMIDAGVTP